MRALSLEEIEVVEGGHIIIRKIIDALVAGQAIDWSIQQYQAAVSSIDNRIIEQSRFAQWAGSHYGSYGFCNF